MPWPGWRTTWLGTDIYLGIFLGYTAVQIALDLKHGVTSKETVITLLAAFVMAIILMLPFWSEDWLRQSFLVSAFAIGGILLLYILARLMAERKINWAFFPLMILASICALAALSMLQSDPLNMYEFVLYESDCLFGGEMIGKIAEAEPLFYDTETLLRLIFSLLGMNILFSLIGLAVFILYIRRRSEGVRPSQLLLIVWLIAALVLTFGQIRFLYLSTNSYGDTDQHLILRRLGRVLEEHGGVAC